MPINKKGRFVKIRHAKGGYGFVYDPDAPPIIEDMLVRATIDLAHAKRTIRDLIAKVSELEAEAIESKK